MACDVSERSALAADRRWLRGEEARSAAGCERRASGGNGQKNRRGLRPSQARWAEIAGEIGDEQRTEDVAGIKDERERERVVGCGRLMKVGGWRC